MPAPQCCRLLATLMTLWFAGCTTIGNGERQADKRNPWTKPGVLRIAGRQQPDNLNPLLGTQTVDVDLSMFWAAYLFRYDDRNELVPELAVREPTMQNGDIRPDGLAVTYHLRRGAKWQDGAPFTADDLIYTWQQVMNPKNLVVTRLGYDVIRGIDRRDDFTIVVHLKRRFSPFVTTFFTLGTHPDCILPKHLLAKYADINRVSYNNLPVGTGPFRVVSYEKGSLIRFAANSAYWRGPPKLQRIDYHIIPSDNTILMMAQTHDIDFYYRASETQASSLRSIPGMRMVVSPFIRFADLGLNAGVAALSDVRIRRALAYATDRRTLVDKVTHGIALRADSDQPPFYWAYNPRVQRYDYDPRRASGLLDEAGWHARTAGAIREKNGQPLRLTLVGFTGSATATEAETLVQQEWREIGIDVSIKNYPSAELYATLGSGGIEQAGKFDVVFENWSNGTDPDDSQLFACTMAPPAGWNIYRFCNPALDAALARGLSNYDQTTRKAAYARVQELVAQELPII
nr:peptide ABC transporter substrate-binding protein [Candidatus Eremiobacteraeota bacterium]